MLRGFSRPLAALVALSVSLATSAYAGGAPGFTSRASDLGATASNKLVPVTIWLKVHDSDGLTAKVQALHDSTSPSFQRFGGVASHTPTAAEASSVSKFLASRGLTV